MSHVGGRRWLRFSLGTLTVALTISCVWLGWWQVIKRQREAEEFRHATYYKQLELLFLVQPEPRLDFLLTTEPPMRQQMVRMLLASFDAECVTLDTCIDGLLTSAQLRIATHRVQGVPYAITVEQDLATDLKRLQTTWRTSSARRPPATPLGEYAIDYALECCQARIARLSGKQNSEKKAIRKAVAIAQQLCQSAEAEFQQEAITVDRLIQSLRCRRDAKLAEARLASDKPAVRAALVEYGKSIRRLCASVARLYTQGARGGEQEQLDWLECCATANTAAMAEVDGDRCGAEAAWQQATRQADQAIASTIAAFDAETVTADLVLTIIKDRSCAAESAARLHGGSFTMQTAEQANRQRFYDFSRRMMRSCLSACPPINSEEQAHFAGCKYILARVREPGEFDF